MIQCTSLRILTAAILAALFLAPGVGARPSEPTPIGRAILPADASAPAPFPGARGRRPARPRRPRAGSLPGRPGDFGLGNPFAMPYVTIEAVLPTGGRRLAIVDDTNFGSRGRDTALPDYSDFIEIEVPGLGRRM